jgi:flagellar FliL protein
MADNERAEGGEGDAAAARNRLKEELTKRVNYALAPNQVNAVLFKEIVVQ